MERYAKQTKFKGLGQKGQERLGGSTVLVAGVGALGGTMAMLLARAGVGVLRLVDRDRAELSNLHRQLLYDEADAAQRAYKARAAGLKLQAANRDILIEPQVAEIAPQNIASLMDGVDLVMDGLDNYAARRLINRQAVRQKTPWLYAGVLGVRGNLMLIRPGQTPCLDCLYPDPKLHAAHPTVDAVGIIGPTPAFAASWAAAEAIKHLSGQPDLLAAGMFQFNLWQNSFELLPLHGGPVKGCPVCGNG